MQRARIRMQGVIFVLLSIIGVCLQGPLDKLGGTSVGTVALVWALFVLCRLYCRLRCRGNRFFSRRRSPAYRLQSAYDLQLSCRESVPALSESEYGPSVLSRRMRSIQPATFTFSAAK